MVDGHSAEVVFNTGSTGYTAEPVGRPLKGSQKGGLCRQAVFN